MLSEYLRATVERLSVDKKEFDAFDHRLRGLSSAITEAETRMDGVLAKDKLLSAMNAKADVMSKDFQTLMAQADEMARKQGMLEALGERLAQVDEVGRRTIAQHEALKQSRQDLDTLRGEIGEFHKSHAEAAQLRDKLSADRASLEAFGERATTLLSRTPELESKMDTVLSKMAIVDDEHQGGGAAGRAGRRARCAADARRRAPAVHREARGPHQQPARRDLGRRSQAERAARAPQRSGEPQEPVRHAGHPGRRRAAEARRRRRHADAAVADHRAGRGARPVESRHSQQLVESVKQDESVVHDQKARLTELVEQSRNLASETAERMKQVQGVSDDLTRADEGQGRVADRAGARPGQAARRGHADRGGRRSAEARRNDGQAARAAAHAAGVLGKEDRRPSSSGSPT